MKIKWFVYMHPLLLKQPLYLRMKIKWFIYMHPLIKTTPLS